MESPRATQRRDSVPLMESIKAHRKRLLLMLFVMLFIAYVASISPSPVSSSSANAVAKSNRRWSFASPLDMIQSSNRRNRIIHPIPKLMSDAQGTYKALLKKQSSSLTQAVKEYKRRYNKDPPKGFDEWYTFAVENGVKIIDDYDQLMKDLEPFWDLDGQEFRRRTNQVGYLPSVDLVRLSNGTSSTLQIHKSYSDAEVSARAKGFRVMIEKFQAKLPDMDFPINAKAEGRILIPWEHRFYPNMTEQDSSGGVEVMLGGEFTPDWRGDSNVWEQFRKTCPPESQARRLFHSMRANLKEGQRPVNLFERHGHALGPDQDFNFASNVDDRYSFCDHPHQHLQQGHFFSDWRTIPVLYPMLSPAKAAGYSDILIPSHYYYSSTRRYTYGWDPENQIVKDVDDMEIPWSRKSEKIFWRGATTGGGSNPSGFSAGYQRHRFLRMTSDHSNSNRTVIFADPPGTDNFVFAKVPIKSMNEDFMDAAFTRAIGCTQYPGGCTALQRDHRFGETVPLGEHWRHKYLIDFDGMGYSARLFAFLASDSAVIKSTVYTEFFSDWIQPWLHYIPLSQSYSEIYNIHAYFSGPSSAMTNAVNHTLNVPRTKNLKELDGDRQLQRIARAGRQWKNTVGRKVDMETYVYRLCLEWARLWADDREAMSYKG